MLGFFCLFLCLFYTDIKQLAHSGSYPSLVEISLSVNFHIVCVMTFEPSTTTLLRPLQKIASNTLIFFPVLKHSNLSPLVQITHFHDFSVASYCVFSSSHKFKEKLGPTV